MKPEGAIDKVCTFCIKHGHGRQNEIHSILQHWSIVSLETRITKNVLLEMNSCPRLVNAVYPSTSVAELKTQRVKVALIPVTWQLG